MKRVLSSVLVVSSALVAGVIGPVVGTGCSAHGGDESLLVLENEATLAGGTCTFTATGTEANISHGEINAASPVGYLMHPLIESQLAVNSTGGSGGSAQRTVLIQGARIDIEILDSTLFSAADLANLQSSGLTHNMAPFSIPVPPSGFAVGEFEAVSQPLLAAIGAKLTGSATAVELEVSSTMFGYIDGDSNNEVDSAPYKFPVTVCTDCVANITGSCSGGSATTGSDTNPCNPYQDGEVDCCTSGTTLICPGD